jgi:hypothetical protein
LPVALLTFILSICFSTNEISIDSNFNLFSEIKKKSTRKYFIERRVGGPKQKDFWPTIKPFIANKGSYFENNIILTDDDIIVNDQNEVAETFNDFFVNVAKDIVGYNLCLFKFVWK